MVNQILNMNKLNMMCQIDYRCEYIDDNLMLIRCFAVRQTNDPNFYYFVYLHCIFSYIYLSSIIIIN